MNMKDFTNAELNLLTHVFYNSSTNELLAIRYRPDLEMCEVERYCDEGRYAVVISSLARIVEDKKTESWEFLDVL